MQIRRFEKETFYYGYNGNDSDSTLIVVIGTIERYYYYIVWWLITSTVINKVVTDILAMKRGGDAKDIAKNIIKVG